VLVGEADSSAALSLDKHLMSGANQLAHTCWCKTNAVFVVLNLFWDAY
jgi:hypothetical protein